MSYNTGLIYGYPKAIHQFTQQRIPYPHVAWINAVPTPPSWLLDWHPILHPKHTFLHQWKIVIHLQMHCSNVTRSTNGTWEIHNLYHQDGQGSRCMAILPPCQFLSKLHSILAWNYVPHPSPSWFFFLHRWRTFSPSAEGRASPRSYKKLGIKYNSFKLEWCA